MKELLRDVEFWIGFCIATFIVMGATTIMVGMFLEDEKQVNMAKQGYEQAEGKQADWGRFLLFLMGLYFLHEVTKTKEGKKKT